MIHFIKKAQLAVTLLLAASVGHAYGENVQSSACCEEQKDTACCQPAPCGTVFVSADLLYWRAFESGLDVCVPSEVVDIVTSDGEVISRLVGKSRDPRFHWDPGFRIGAGYTAACSDWDFAAFWTHFHSRASDSRNRGNHLHWNVNLDVVDLIAGYGYDFCSCFCLRPYFGLRGAKIDQKLHIHDFSNFSSSSSSSLSSSGFRSERRNKEKFVGVGPLLGLEADWNVGCGLSVFANASVSWLYGKYHVRFSETDEIVDAFNFCEQKKQLEATQTVGDAALGIRWEKCFCCDKHVLLQLALEHHCYFDHNRMGNCGDLSFDGLTFSAAFEF